MFINSDAKVRISNAKIQIKSPNVSRNLTKIPNSKLKRTQNNNLTLKTADKVNNSTPATYTLYYPPTNSPD